MAINIEVMDPQVLAHTPVAPPPPGVTPNFVHPHSDKDVLIYTGSVLMALAFMFYVNRIYVKAFGFRKVSWDDLTLSVAFLATAFFFGTEIYLFVVRHAGIHPYDMSLLTVTSKSLTIPAYLVGFIPSFCMMFIKVTFFIMYLDLFQVVGWVRICSWVGGVLNMMVYGALIITYLVIATPSHGQTWAYHGMHRPDHLQGILSIASGSFGCAIDCYIFLLPLLGIYKVQMRFEHKLGVYVVFLSAIFAVIASVFSVACRAKYLKDGYNMKLLSISTTSIIVELFVGIIVACMPSMSHTCRRIASSTRLLRIRIRSFVSRHSPSRSPSRSSCEKPLSGNIDPSASQARGRGKKGPSDATLIWGNPEQDFATIDEEEKHEPTVESRCVSGSGSEVSALSSEGGSMGPPTPNTDRNFSFREDV